MSKRRLDIVGAGKVGKTLARLWNQNGFFDIGSVANRSVGSSEEAIDFIGAGKTSQIQKIDVLMISAADGAIAECCAHLAESAMIESGAVVFHCSGSISSDILAPLKAKGATIASIHPVKSFADLAVAIKTFSGTFCGLEGDLAAVRILTEAVGAIGGKAFAIDSSAKTIYHAGSVFSSNYLVSTLAAGIDCLVKAGIGRETAVEVLKPIATEALENLFRLGPVQALTGPIARGEAKVIEGQALALAEWDTEISSAYGALGLLAIHLSQQQGSASEESIQQMKRILSDLI